MSNKKKLNARQMLFVDNVMQGMSLAKAYQEAGYNAKGYSVYSCSSDLLRNTNILEELDNRIETRRKSVSARLMSITDGATNAYIKILNIKAKEQVGKDKKGEPEYRYNDKLIEIQRKVAYDLFDRAGLKPVEETNVTGSIEVITAIPRPEKEK